VHTGARWHGGESSAFRSLGGGPPLSRRAGGHAARRVAAGLRAPDGRGGDRIARRAGARADPRLPSVGRRSADRARPPRRAARGRSAGGSRGRRTRTTAGSRPIPRSSTTTATR
jgi:hypothetical protein